jgi:hypothetical protein
MRRCGLRVVVLKTVDDETVVYRSDINHGDTHCGWRIADAFVVVRGRAPGSPSAVHDARDGWPYGEAPRAVLAWWLHHRRLDRGVPAM